jgi:hypothetical protein
MSLSLSSSALKRRQQRQQPQPILNLPANQPTLSMSQALTKTVIAQDAPNGSDTDHLLPVIDFLKAQGYTPATGDKFDFNRDGLGTYGFQEPLDVALLQEHFVFPPTIKLSVDGLHDTRHFVRIGQGNPNQPARKMSFEA